VATRSQVWLWLSVQSYNLGNLWRPGSVAQGDRELLLVGLQRRLVEDLKAEAGES
jgi:hypothetical protein